MRYELIGESIKVPFYGSNRQKFCDIVATYRPIRHERGKYQLELKLNKIVNEGGGEYNFEHIIDSQPISTKPYYARADVLRIIRYGLVKHKFNDHIAEFKDEIRQSLYICNTPENAEA